MSTTSDASPQSTLLELVAPRPKRADARRNYDKILNAAREAFAEGGAATSLEEIARRAEVGIGTLYRNFPTRQALLEAAYVGEVEQLCTTASELTELAPWEAFEALVRRLVGYLVTKQALASELVDYVAPGSGVFACCRNALFDVGEPLLARAQQAKAVRADTDFSEVVQLVGGIAKIQPTAPGQVEHILAIALDGLRYRPV